MIKIPEDHIQQYLKIFGTGLDQFDILQEECAELIKALGKYKRSVGHFTNVDPIDNIVEEMTHVAISSEIVARILNINPEDIQREVNKKAVKYNLSKGDLEKSESPIFDYGICCDRRGEAMKIKNAKIRSTMLGRENHGIMTFMIYISAVGLMISTLLLRHECSEPSPWKRYLRFWR